MTDDEQGRISDSEIDLDRVIVDPTYRRRVIQHLRAEAERRPKPALLRGERAPAHTRRDD